MRRGERKREKKRQEGKIKKDKGEMWKVENGGERKGEEYRDRVG